MPARASLARSVVVGAAFAVVASLLSGCSTSNASSDEASKTDTRAKSGQPKDTTTTGKPDRPAPPPKAGGCRELTFGEINRFSNSTATTSCKRPHTAYTFVVTPLPDDVAFAGVDIGNDAVQGEAARSCRSRFAAYVGGSAATRSLSRLSVTYFLPVQDEFDLGARWVRCDVVALQSARILAELPDPLKGFNDTEGALDEYGVCSRGEPGLVDSMLVMCDQPHTYRGLAALRLGAEDASYPGETVTRQQGQQRCADVVAAELGRSGGYSYTWTYPSSEDWGNGQRFGFCWTKTSG